MDVDGGVYCFGDSRAGQACTTGTVTPAGHNVLTDPTLTPNRLSCGDYHSCVVTGGAVRCCGDPQLTNDAGPQLQDQVVSDSVLSVGTGFRHTCVTTDQDAVWCFGRPDNGKLGPGGDQQMLGYHPPTQVFQPFAATAEVYVGWEHNCAVSDNREQVACWGINNHGQLGTAPGNTANCTGCSEAPVPVIIPQQMQ